MASPLTSGEIESLVLRTMGFSMADLESLAQEAALVALRRHLREKTALQVHLSKSNLSKSNLS